jgi:hypothetical protein
MKISHGIIKSYFTDVKHDYSHNNCSRFLRHSSSRSKILELLQPNMPVHQRNATDLLPFTSNPLRDTPRFVNELILLVML